MVFGDCGSDHGTTALSYLGPFWILWGLVAPHLARRWLAVRHTKFSALRLFVCGHDLLLCGGLVARRLIRQVRIPAIGYYDLPLLCTVFSLATSLDEMIIVSYHSYLSVALHD